MLRTLKPRYVKRAIRAGKVNARSRKIVCIVREWKPPEEPPLAPFADVLEAAVRRLEAPR